VRLFGRREPKSRRELAALGEEHAARYLASRGYRIRERNFRLARGPEIDIIAEHGDVLVFVEVKARTSSGVFQPRDAVTSGKERQIARAAAAYLGLRERRERVARFDIVEVYLTPEGRLERIEVIEGAFKAR
jgi:putative endonuclease